MKKKIKYSQGYVSLKEIRNISKDTVGRVAVIVSYKNFEARFLKTTFLKLACRITQKVFNRLTSTTFYFVDNKQLLYMNYRYS